MSRLITQTATVARLAMPRLSARQQLGLAIHAAGALVWMGHWGHQLAAS
ncbi:MAG: hypothetical protein RLZZ592_2053 [Pseudomonadota bacterium]